MITAAGSDFEWTSYRFKTVDSVLSSAYLIGKGLLLTLFFGRLVILISGSLLAVPVNWLGRGLLY